jgi:hypothetical protein
VVLDVVVVVPDVVVVTAVVEVVVDEIVDDVGEVGVVVVVDVATSIELAGTVEPPESDAHPIKSCIAKKSGTQNDRCTVICAEANWAGDRAT